MRLATALCAMGAFATVLATADTAEARRIGPRPTPTMVKHNVSWIPTVRGQGLPHRAFQGGTEPARRLYVCRGWHNNGLHPGKVVAGYCNIGWGGKEILLRRYEVLRVKNRKAVRWVTGKANPRMLNKRAVFGGYERGRTLHICRARYKGGMHPGKVVAGKCNIGWGGREITLKRYQVLIEKPFRWHHFKRLPGAIAPLPSKK